MDGIKLSRCRLFFMLNGITFIDLLLIMTMLQDLCALRDIPAQVSATGEQKMTSSSYHP